VAERLPSYPCPGDQACGRKTTGQRPRLGTTAWLRVRLRLRAMIRRAPVTYAKVVQWCARSWSRAGEICRDAGEEIGRRADTLARSCAATLGTLADTLARKLLIRERACSLGKALHHARCTLSMYSGHAQRATRQCAAMMLTQSRAILTQLRTLHWSRGTMGAAVASPEDYDHVRYPPAPDGYTLYVIGDIHGRLDLLLDLQQRIDDDKSRLGAGQTAEIYLGDYIDRGPESAGVVSRLIARGRETRAILLRGNHEQMLLDLLDGDDDCLGLWRAVGGTATMMSYGLPPRLLTRQASAGDVRRSLLEKIPPEHLKFYGQTGAYMRAGAYLAVHGGIRPGVRLEDQKISDLLGIRQEFLQYEGDFDFIVVHGHTPVMDPDLRHNRINIDTGAFATSRLTCLKISGDGAQVLGG
jgi:calcineurin-like phosphoesterase family protein